MDAKVTKIFNGLDNSLGNLNSVQAAQLAGAIMAQAGVDSDTTAAFLAEFEETDREELKAQLAE